MRYRKPKERWDTGLMQFVPEVPVKAMRKRKIKVNNWFLLFIGFMIGLGLILIAAFIWWR